MSEKIYLYLKIGVGEFQHVLDHFVSEVLPHAVAIVSATQWFFIRYYDDEDGLHLRFRVLIEASKKTAALESLGNVFRHHLLQLNTLPASDYQPLVSMGELTFAAKPLSVREEEYVPEYEKFGGQQGMPDAHAWFHVSSEIVSEILQQEARGETSRKTFAPILMAIVLDSMVSDPCLFLENYSLLWLPQDIGQQQMLREEFFDKADELLKHGVEIVQSPAMRSKAANALVARWQLCVQESLARFAKYVPLEDGYAINQAWQMIHLMNNRLGFSPIEEAYLASLLEAHYRMAQRHAA